MAGRKRFKPTKDQRETVKLLKADGWPNERIARHLVLARNTLESAFAVELEFGADAKRVENLASAQKAAKKGNATMIKWLQDRFDRARAKAQLDERAGHAAEPPVPPKAEKLGKKQERLRAAQEVTGKFAPPPPPKLH